MRGIPVALLLALLLALGGAAPAGAHLLPAQNATMHVVGSSAYCVVSVPASALAGIDDDHSGGLSLLEIQRHSRAIAAQFAARFRVADTGNAVQMLPAFVATPQTEGAPVDQRYAVVLMQARFARPPLHPTVTSDLFGSAPGEGQLTLTATRGAEAEVAILAPDMPTHTYFRGSLATFLDFVRVGVAHILTGPDHLLFLLTVVVALTGWRAWLAMVTSFTLAHSITLTLAVLGVLRVSPLVVEPGIAASIVAMATLNLYGAPAVARSGLWRRSGIVFACGLLHGLGFASAIGTMRLDAAHRLVTLAGFNLGIELGQLLFLAALVVLARALSGLAPLRRAPAFARLASITAAVLGAVVLVARIIPALPGPG